MKPNKEVLLIAEAINNIVTSKIKHVEYKNNRWKELYETTIEDMGHELALVNSDIESVKEDGLTFNALELEGYKRCLLTRINRMKEDIKYIKDEE